MSLKVSKPLVSVCMITYNHRDYITQAIEGVLLQEINFPLELVIGEDVSTDGTLDICINYQERFPDIIKILDTTINVGVQKNFQRTIEACSGKYVAICEGDDYWTDPLKLQKQIDFLEQNPTFTICHHPLEILFPEKPAHPTSTPKSPSVITFEDLALHQQIATASCVFRNKLFTFPDFFVTVYGTDYALHLLNAYYGPIKFIDQIMGVYRVHNQGEWSGRSVFDRTVKAIETAQKCANYFAPRGVEEFDFHITRLQAHANYNNGDYGSFRKKTFKLLARHIGKMTLRDFLSLGTKYLSSFPRQLFMPPSH